jgi:hypothetical protein
VSKIGSVFSVFSAKIFFSGRLFKTVPLRNLKKKKFFISPSEKIFFLIFKKIFYLFFNFFPAFPLGRFFFPLAENKKNLYF